MQIIFTAEKKILSYLIRYATEKSWIGSARCSHVANRYGGTEEKWMIEANRHGFVPNWWPQFKEKHLIVKNFEFINIEEKILDEVMDELINELIFTRYDVIGMAGFAWVIIWYGITGKKIKNPFVFVQITKEKIRYFVIPAKNIIRLCKEDFESYMKSAKHRKPVEDIRKANQIFGVEVSEIKDFEDRWDYLGL